MCKTLISKKSDNTIVCGIFNRLPENYPWKMHRHSPTTQIDNLLHLPLYNPKFFQHILWIFHSRYKNTVESFALNHALSVLKVFALLRPIFYLNIVDCVLRVGQFYPSYWWLSESNYTFWLWTFYHLIQVALCPMWRKRSWHKYRKFSVKGWPEAFYTI